MRKCAYSACQQSGMHAAERQSTESTERQRRASVTHNSSPVTITVSPAPSNERYDTTAARRRHSVAPVASSGSTVYLPLPPSTRRRVSLEDTKMPVLTESSSTQGNVARRTPARRRSTDVHLKNTDEYVAL